MQTNVDTAWLARVRTLLEFLALISSCTAVPKEARELLEKFPVEDDGA